MKNLSTYIHIQIKQIFQIYKGEKTMSFMRNNWLWGTTFTVDEAYKLIINRDKDHFDFLYKRLFENERTPVIYQNLLVEELIKLQEYTYLLNQEAKDKWDFLFEEYRERRESFLKTEFEERKDRMLMTSLFCDRPFLTANNVHMAILNYKYPDKQPVELYDSIIKTIQNNSCKEEMKRLLPLDEYNMIESIIPEQRKSFIVDPLEIGIK